MDIKNSFPFQLVVAGTVGLLFIIVLNAIAYMGMGLVTAKPFHGEWWTVWHPHYVVWFGFFMVGGIAWLMEPES